MKLYMCILPRRLLAQDVCVLWRNSSLSVFILYDFYLVALLRKVGFFLMCFSLLFKCKVFQVCI